MASVLYSAFDIVPSPKGASTHITYFIRGLVEAGHRVTLLTPAATGLPGRETYFGADLIRLEVSEEANYLQRALDFAEAVIRHLEHSPEINIAHFRSVWDGYLLAQAQERFGYKTLFEVNGLPSIELKYHYPGIKDQPVLGKIKEQEIATLALSDAIICPSGVTRAYIASLGVRREKVVVIPNGVDTILFSPQPYEFHTQKERQLVYTGTLADWQGVDVLIRAVGLIQDQLPVKLRIVGHGRGRQKKELLKRLRKLGLENTVTIEPAIPHEQIPVLLAGADACVAPLSYNDRNVTQGCCPIKVLEYMACGRPVIASNLPVVRELAREDQEALLFTPDDPGDLARCLLKVLNDEALARSLSASAVRRVQERFTWKAAQKKLLKVYDSLSGG